MGDFGGHVIHALAGLAIMMGLVYHRVMKTRPSVTLIAGATGTGKSTYALQQAMACDGVIINADSMQVYRELRILSARPTPADEARALHVLYGHIGGSESYSVAQWAREAAQCLSNAQANGQPAFVVGGTGLYFRVLLEGLSPIPEIPPTVRNRWRQAGLSQSAEDLHQQLASIDHLAADHLAPTDTQRIVRALEVMEATGRSIISWRSIAPT
ncbi:MAG: tRNA (adenosine(37)-N6)-dimethylallyltransferase MiaA, partial [Pseudomonadota bacterium]